MDTINRKPDNERKRVVGPSSFSYSGMATMPGLHASIVIRIEERKSAGHGCYEPMKRLNNAEAGDSSVAPPAIENNSESKEWDPQIKIPIKVRATAWLAALAFGALPLVPFLLVINRDFTGGFELPEKAIVAVAGFIAIVVSTSKAHFHPDSSDEVRSSIGWLVVSLLLWFFCGLLKVSLFHAWKGGDFSAEFSLRDFNVLLSSFIDASQKPFSFLRWVMFLSGAFAWLAFVAGAFKFLRLLFPAKNASVVPTLVGTPTTHTQGSPGCVTGRNESQSVTQG